MNKSEIRKIWALLYCLITTLIFSFHFFAAKLVLKEVPPLIFAASRGILGGLILFVIFRKDIIKYLNWKNLKDLSIIAFLGFFINQIFVGFDVAFARVHGHILVKKPVVFFIQVQTLPRFTTFGKHKVPDELMLVE